MLTGTDDDDDADEPVEAASVPSRAQCEAALTGLPAPNDSLCAAQPRPIALDRAVCVECPPSDVITSSGAATSMTSSRGERKHARRRQEAYCFRFSF